MFNAFIKLLGFVIAGLNHVSEARTKTIDANYTKIYALHNANGKAASERAKADRIANYLKVGIDG